MARKVTIPEAPSLEAYEAIAHLAPAVRELRAEAALLAAKLTGRTVWMVNSTEQGGGVAEMLPTMVALLRALGVRTEWVVIESEHAEFFAVTKKLHNLVHGVGEPTFASWERAVFEAENEANARQMAPWLAPGDLLVVHDPQPMPLATILRQHVGLGKTIWRCHIGLDEETPQTRAAWQFLQPYAEAYEHAIFSAPEYIPPYFSSRSSLIYPAINPLTGKNHDLSLHQLTGTLINAALTTNPGPVLTPMFAAVAERLQPDGRFRPANMTEDIGLLTRPIVTQISRWDHLKGYLPLMRAFAALKAQARNTRSQVDPLHERRLELVRLVLAGPEPAAIADDPEGKQVLQELAEAYQTLPAYAQRDIAIIALPMSNRAQNALMVNAIQRASTIIVQNSLREGFGLTVTEAMWKRIPVLSNRRACGPRQQIRDRIDGRMIADPDDSTELASALHDMLAQPAYREAWGRSAQRRVHDHFLIFAQVRSWLERLTMHLEEAAEVT